MQNKTVWRFISENLSGGNKVILLSVISSKGGSPGKSGFKLAVTEKELWGTIGGGVMEFNLVNEARNAIKKGALLYGMRNLHHSQDTDKQKSGMVCAGCQTVAIYTFKKEDEAVVKHICAAIQNLEPITFKVTNRNISILENSDDVNTEHTGDEWSYIEKIQPKEILYIAGGGHVGKAVARVMDTLGFRITVFDDREEIIDALNEMNPGIAVKKDLAFAGDGITEGSNVYFIILTPSHLWDKAALKSVIKKNIRYIGMMGSKNKVRSIFSQLEAEGIPASLLEKVHAPIGLQINSNTAEEIAISIAAEIIQVKNSV